MRPLEPLASVSPIRRLLAGAPAVEARAELGRLDELVVDPLLAAARCFARGALALREGELDRAHAELTAADRAFADLGEREAAELARCEAWLAAVRRGPRSVYAEASAALAALAAAAGVSARVEVVALHYRGTATRFAGDAVATQGMLLAAFARLGPFLEERAQVLNSVGTLYVVMGAFGAAEALLEHAAELHHQTGDAVGEAIAFGQLGSAALGRGDLERARRHLQRQEWLASRVGDAFGRARALTFLADVALELGRPDDALALARDARVIASAVSPPLGMWVAYASRAIGRALVELGDPAAREELDRSVAAFATIGNQLGDALARWDLAHLDARAGGAEGAVHAAGGAWFEAAWAFGSLGLTSRVAQLLADQRRDLIAADAPRAAPREEVIAAAAQGFPHLVVAQELELVYGAPERLAAIAARRTAAQRNLGRLAALTLAAPGLWVAAVAGRGVGGGGRAMPPQRSAAVALAEVGGVAIWAWPSSTAVVEVARDLAAVRASLGQETRAVLATAERARVIAPAFAGEAGAGVEELDIQSLLRRLLALAPGALEVDPAASWSPDAEGLARLAGYTR